MSVWLREGHTRAPLYVELELASACPHRCTFCGVSHLVDGSRGRLDPGRARGLFHDLAVGGGRALLVSGHGEPLLHPEAPALIADAARSLRVALTTNGQGLDDGALPLIDALAWLRVSINGGDADTYARVHGCPPQAFLRVLDHVASAVDRKRRLGLGVTLGVQVVVVPENVASLPELARRVRAIGVDYLSVKPYSRHPGNPAAGPAPGIDWDALADELEPLSTPTFALRVRRGTAARIRTPRTYGACLAAPFMAFVDAAGEVWACLVHAGDTRFSLGRLEDAPIGDLWASARARQVMDFVAREVDVSRCRAGCRLDAANAYLWRLRNPLAHDDFI